MSALLNDIIHREIEKRRRHRAPLSIEEFHELLTWLAYIMTRNDSRSFSIDQVEKFIEGRVKSEHAQSGDITKEMTEQFRTQTWLHAEGDHYRFRHEVFTHILAAQYIVDNLSPENLSYVQDWNPDSANAATVIDFVRELLEPPRVVAATAALEATPTAHARSLTLAILSQLDKSAEARAKAGWIQEVSHELLGKAIKAAVNEQEVAGAVMSCIIPAIPRSSLAVEATLCFLALAKQRLGSSGVEILRQSRRIAEELSNLRSSSGHYLNFEDLLSEKRNAESYYERLLRAAGLNTREFVNPAMYEPVFNELTQQLPDSTPTGRYVRHAAQYLTSYVKSSHRKQR